MIQIVNPESSGLADWVSIGIAVAALIGATISTLLTWSSVRSQDKHNRLSLKPLPRIGVGDYLSRLYVKVVNDGPGPLIIKEVRVSDDAKVANNLLSFMDKVPNTVVWEDFVVEAKDRSIRSNDEMILLALKGDSKDPKFEAVRSSVRLILAKLTVEVEYTDVYGTEFEACTRVLTWFARE